MRRLLAVMLMLCVAGAAMAMTVNTSNTSDKVSTWIDNGDGAFGRQGGDTVADATVIPSLPYNDTGATCGYVNDYDEVCPYTGSTAPDVVYSFTPSAADIVTIDLCASLYDTKVFVYAGAPGNLVACNDDAGCGYSGYQSQIVNLALAAGTTYFIVVDGYFGACGSYTLDVTHFEPPVVDCPAGAVLEGEPPCVDNYLDVYNSGCNGPVGQQFWTAIEATAGGCVDVCGKSCTYNYQGSSYRDTDWYSATCLGGTVSMDVIAEFALQIILIYGCDCNNLLYTYATAPAMAHATLSYFMPAGAPVWFWVGASTFFGVPESDYLMRACGIEGEVINPVVPSTWGTIKHNYN